MLVDRARPGSKHHVLTDGVGIPLAVLLTGGNRNDVIGLEPLLDAVPNVRGRRGRPRRRPKTVYADRGYDHDKYRRRLRTRASRLGSPVAANPTAPAWAPSGGSWNARCAPRGALLYPRLSREELGGRFLGRMAYLMPKG